MRGKGQEGAAPAKGAQYGQGVCSKGGGTSRKHCLDNLQGVPKNVNEFGRA